jgi:hypothetical protein
MLLLLGWAERRRRPECRRVLGRTMKEEPLSVSTAWGKTTEVGTHRNIQNVTGQSSLEPGGRNRSFSFVLFFVHQMHKLQLEISIRLICSNQTKGLAIQSQKNTLEKCIVLQKEAKYSMFLKAVSFTKYPKTALLKTALFYKSQRFLVHNDTFKSYSYIRLHLWRGDFRYTTKTGHM